MPSENKPAVSLLPAPAYDVEALTKDILRHFELLGVAEIDPAAKVVVKPNLIMRCPPERTATTHPAVVEAVVAALQARGARDITIADSPGGLYTVPLLTACYAQTGMTGVAERTGISCNFDLASRELRRTENRLCHSFDILSPIAQADLVVNVCKVKTHCMMTFSCAVKNLFGCLPGLQKPQLHYRFPEEARFAEMLLDLAQTVPPSLTIVDGVDGMEGDGPTAGVKKHLGVTAAARADGIYALDLLLAGMIGLDAPRLPTVAESIRRGLCPDSPKQVTVLGEPALAERVVPFAVPASRPLDFSRNIPAFLFPLARALRPLLATRPVIRRRDCIGCGRCVETCPADTILLRDQKARIQPAACIRCFCCHELCPVKAIDIKVPALFALFRRLS